MFSHYSTATQLRVLKITKALLLVLLGISFALEFVLLNLVSDVPTKYNEQVLQLQPIEEQIDTTLTSYKDSVTQVIYYRWKKLLTAVKKKNEQNKKEEKDTSYHIHINLFITPLPSYALFCTKPMEINEWKCRNVLLFTSPFLSEVFHPPQFV
jgi:hypothetical protein